MPTRSQLLPVLGPLLDLGPRVLVLLFAGVVALAAATTCARAIRLCRPLWFLGGWLVGGVAVVAARVGAESLAAYGRSGWQSGDGVPGALSIAGVAAFVQPRLLVIALSVAFGAAMSVVMPVRGLFHIPAYAATVRRNCRDTGRMRQSASRSDGDQALSKGSSV